MNEEEIKATACGVLAGTHPYAQWTHAAHFAAALWLLRERDALAACGGMGPVIRAYNAAVGVPETETRGYHETITQASLGAAGAALDANPADAPLAPILAALLAGPCGRSDWLMAHWRRETLFSPRARREWVEPDLAPLPWAREGGA